MLHSHNDVSLNVLRWLHLGRIDSQYNGFFDDSEHLSKPCGERIFHHVRSSKVGLLQVPSQVLRVPPQKTESPRWRQSFTASRARTGGWAKCSIRVWVNDKEKQLRKKGSRFLCWRWICLINFGRAYANWYNESIKTAQPFYLKPILKPANYAFLDEKIEWAFKETEKFINDA